ncbi:ribosomal RNA-processing protein 14-like [Diospyros lotus]|uniref:ribosomal RNA-processing protein 14-like n=1 Tax=Diospyros lotus TaxID=55363 RepID=UPI00225011A0|nr:ribosomal RNA-processing protein 14-like [Diospyros lotus]
MKKKQKASQPVSTATAAVDGGGVMDLKPLIRDHSTFFDRLVELIPAKFYLPNDDDAKPWFQGLNKAAKEAAKKQTRDNIKKARRDRLDPDKSQTSSTLDLLKQSLQKEKEAYDIEPITNLDGGKESVTYEELRYRLHRRIEELRSNRGGSGGERPKSENKEKKRKRGSEGDGRSSRVVEDGDNQKSEGEIEKDVAEATKGIEFGKIRLGGEEEKGRKKKKRKLSKVKELERAEQLKEAKGDPERGEGVSKKHSWKAAVSRAAGIKVHDDPKLLKQSMKKEKKRHEKNVEKWKERVDSRQKMKGEKQQKRADNIAERIHQKKMRKIAKREKKLLRPGFEGRKDGYINQD